MYRNNEAERPLVENCGDYVSFVNAGAIWKTPETGGNNYMCFHPGVHGLDNIATHYPNSTIMMFKWDAEKWITGARNWKNILGKLAAYCDGFPRQASPLKNNVTDSMWAAFYHGYLESIRQFTRDHPTLTYVEVDLESSETPSILEKVTGLPGTCYGHNLALER